MNKKKLVKNIKIFSTVFILSIYSYNISDMILGTYEYYDTIEKEQNIDDLEDYVLQGLCKVDDKYLLSAYDSNGDNESIIYIVNEDLTKYSKRKLDSYSHVGGITYDPINENIWITDTNGTIAAYDKDEIMNNTSLPTRKKTIYVGDKLNNIFGECSAAYITYNDNKLYVGNFNFKRNTVIKEYDILENGMINTTQYKEIKVTGFIQGINFYEDDSKKYLIVSSSYGKHFDSDLQIFDFSTLEKIKEIKTNKMMEEIIVDKDKLITIYESNAKIYKNSSYSTDIIISNMNKILSKK